MGSLATYLQKAIRTAPPRGWRCSTEEHVLDEELRRVLGYAPRADVVLTNDADNRRLWIELEVSRADPVANHAKFATAAIFSPPPASDVFVSMVSRRVEPGRRNLGAAAVYLMRSMGLAAFQVPLLPQYSREQINALNCLSETEIAGTSGIEPAAEVERAIVATRTLATGKEHRIHFCANELEVMLNVHAWNEAVRTEEGRKLWGRRSVRYLAHDPRTGRFAPAKFCAFVPVVLGQLTGRAPVMDMATYAALDESETRFDGHIARTHLERQLSFALLDETVAAPALAAGIRTWMAEHEALVRPRKDGIVILCPRL